MVQTNIPLVVIVGPTAVGKTALGIQLAQQFKGEIISADSRQFYRTMDIGTAKPTPGEQAAARHHLIDIADPDETVGLAQFLKLARASTIGVKLTTSFQMDPEFSTSAFVVHHPEAGYFSAKCAC